MGEWQKQDVKDYSAEGKTQVKALSLVVTVNKRDSRTTLCLVAASIPKLPSLML